jgi:hypothetical protein
MYDRRATGFGVVFVSVFLVWVGQLVFEWLDYANEEEARGRPAVLV